MPLTGSTCTEVILNKFSPVPCSHYQVCTEPKQAGSSIYSTENLTQKSLRIFTVMTFPLHTFTVVNDKSLCFFLMTLFNCILPIAVKKETYCYSYSNTLANAIAHFSVDKSHPEECRARPAESTDYNNHRTRFALR